MKNTVLAFDIGGTSAKYAYISQQGMVTNQGRFDTSAMDSREEFFTSIQSVIGKAVSEGISRIGIASLGMFNQSGMCLGGVENLPFLEQMNLPEQIRAWYPEVACHIMNDGVAAAMGEYWIGEGQGCNNFICIILGTGIGGAIVINGKPLLGSHFQSGEIGYSNYKSEEDYLELHYSTKGILKTATAHMDKKGMKEMDGMTFVELVKEDNTVCAALFNEWIDALASMIANSILLLDPEKVIIGGGISGQKEWIREALDKHIQLHLPPAFQGKVAVKVAKYGNDAGLLGAAESYFNI